MHVFVLPSSRKLPTGHGTQSLLGSFGANPVGQDLHDELSGGANVPSEHATHPVRPSFSSWPAPHAVQPDLALLLYLFSGHSTHTPGLEVLDSAFE